MIATLPGMEPNDPIHLVAPKKLDYTGSTDLALLWRSGHVYLMDNHRAAAWCWARHVPPTHPFSLIHIDRHSDLQQSRIQRWLELLPEDLCTMSLEDYLARAYPDGDLPGYPLITWGNYITIFLHQRRDCLDCALFSTPQEGDRPWFPHDREPLRSLVSELGSHLEKSDHWIVNLDLDVFFRPDDPDCESYSRTASDEDISRLGRQIVTADRQGHVACITIAITPEVCGGWQNAGPVIDILRTCGISLPELDWWR